MQKLTDSTQFEQLGADSGGERRCRRDGREAEEISVSAVGTFESIIGRTIYGKKLVMLVSKSDFRV